MYITEIIVTRQKDELDSDIDVKKLLFASKDIAKDFIEFLKHRWELIDLNYFSYDETKWSHSFSLTDDSNTTVNLLMYSTSDVKRYEYNRSVYRIIVEEVNDKAVNYITMSDIYVDKKAAESIASLINNNSTAYKAKVVHTLVITSNEDLEMLTKFIIHGTGHLIDNIFNYTCESIILE